MVRSCDELLELIRSPLSTSATTEFETIKPYRIEFEGLLKRMRPQLVVMETCSITGWVHDLCVKQGYEVLVADPSQKAWRWKHVKRKTDKDDALKLAKLTALGQINPVYVPAPHSRQHRQLVKYRKTIVNHRAMFICGVRLKEKKGRILLDKEKDQTRIHQ